MRPLAVSLILLLPAAARAQDGEQAPPPPATARPAIPPPSPIAAPLVDEERIEQIVDRAVERALARRLPAALQQSQQQQPTVTASAQGIQARPTAQAQARTQIVEAPARERIEYAPVVRRESSYARVLVPAPIHRRAAAAVGEKLVECGRPRTKWMKLAPAEVVQTVTYAATPTRPVYATSQAD